MNFYAKLQNSNSLSNKQKMNTDLMLDTLSALIERSQSQIQQIISKNKPLSSKIRYVSLNLTQLKFEILQWLLNVIKQSKTNQLQSKLYQLKTQTFQQLSHIRLHTLLKSKLNQLKKSSFLNSILVSDQNQSQNEQNPSKNNQNQSINDKNLSKLQQSVILLQKDMNIHEDEEQDFNVSAIIQKTKLNLLQDNSLNQSTFSQSSLFLASHNFQPIKNVQFSLKDQSFSKDKLQSSNKETEINARFQQNQGKLGNFNKTISLNELKNQNPSNLNINTVLPNQQNVSKEKHQNIDNVQEKEKLKPIQKVMKKKKKNISSANANSSSLNKQDLLGNLLQQTYNQHFQQTS